MSVVSASVILTILLIVALIILFIKHLKRNKQFGTKEFGLLLIIVLLITAIPAFGHSKLNRELQLNHIINTFNRNEALTPDADKNAVEELANLSKPVKIEVIREEITNPEDTLDPFYNEYIAVNGQKYVVTLVCYTAPLSWTIFETYQLNKIIK